MFIIFLFSQFFSFPGSSIIVSVFFLSLSFWGLLSSSFPFTDSSHPSPCILLPLLPSPLSFPLPTVSHFHPPIYLSIFSLYLAIFPLPWFTILASISFLSFSFSHFLSLCGLLSDGSPHSSPWSPSLEASPPRPSGYWLVLFPPHKFLINLLPIYIFSPERSRNITQVFSFTTHLCFLFPYTHPSLGLLFLSFISPFLPFPNFPLFLSFPSPFNSVFLYFPSPFPSFFISFPFPCFSFLSFLTFLPSFLSLSFLYSHPSLTSFLLYLTSLSRFFPSFPPLFPLPSAFTFTLVSLFFCTFSFFL